MELVFIHGWGFDADFWNGVAEFLPQFPQRRVDLGYFGNPSAIEKFGNQSILVGHSLGFQYGFVQKKDWRGWVAINAFTRFVSTEDKPGCVPQAQLRALKLGLSYDSIESLDGFHTRLGSEKPEGLPDIGRLRAGLDELQRGDIAGDAAALDAPGLLLAARNDPLVPTSISEELGRATPKCDIVWHDTGGHILPLTAAGWCGAAIRKFAESIPGRA